MGGFWFFGFLHPAREEGCRGEGGRQQNKGGPPHLSLHAARPWPHDTRARYDAHAASPSKSGIVSLSGDRSRGNPPCFPSPGKNGRLVFARVYVFASQEDTAPRGSSASKPRAAEAATDATATTEAAAAKAAAGAAAADARHHCFLSSHRSSRTPLCISTLILPFLQLILK